MGEYDGIYLKVYMKCWFDNGISRLYLFELHKIIKKVADLDD